MSRLLVGLVLVALAAASAAIVATAQNAQAVLVETAAIAPLDLTRFGQPALSAASVTEALDHGLRFRDRPSFGSGLTWLGGQQFIGVTDRGPNDDHPAVVGRATGILFPLPRFTPSLVHFAWRGGSIVVSTITPLHGKDGHGVTGLPNQVADGAGYDRPGAARPLPVDPNGLDIEGVRRLPDGRYLLADEYGPSLVVASAEGEVLKRYVPASRAEPPQTMFAVEAGVPEVYSRHRANRGFESVAVSSDGRRAWTVMESPLGPRDDPRYAPSRTVRILEWDVADPLKARAVAEFVVHLTPLDHVPTATRQDDIKLSDAAALSNRRLLVVERAPRRVRLVVIDLSHATNLLEHREGGTLAVDAFDAPLADWGIRPAATAVAFDSREMPTLDQDKIEGLAIVSDREVVIASDNDFGMGDNISGAPAQLWRLRWPVAVFKTR